MSYSITILPVILPLFFAPILAVITNRKAAICSAIIFSFTLLCLSLKLYGLVKAEDVLLYHFGGFGREYGIEYKLDKFNIFFLILIDLLGFFSILYSAKMVKIDYSDKQISRLYALFFLSISGLSGMIITNDIFNLYVFIEISSLAAYSLVALGTKRAATLVAFEYLIIGSVAASFFLLAIGILYMFTGTLNITEMAKLVDMRLLSTKLAMILIIVGLLMKSACFPFHNIFIKLYANAPRVIAPYFAGINSKISFIALVKLCSVLFVDYRLDNVFITNMINILVMIGIVLISFYAILENDLRRILSYSSIIQTLYFIIVLISFRQDALKVILILMVAHSITKACIFMISACIEYRINSSNINDFKGLFKYMPFEIAAFIFNAASLIAIPFTLGFNAKWDMLEYLLLNKHIFLFITVIISSLLTAFYFWHIIEIVYFKQKKQPTNEYNLQTHNIPYTAKLPIFALTMMNIFLAFNPNLLYI